MIPVVVSGLVLMKKRRMMEVFSPRLRKTWKEIQLRAMAIISLVLQIILIYFGKKRRHIHGRWIRVVVWSTYLMADAVATIALGILSNDLGDIYDDGGKLDSNNELIALWAPFFLLHLGGPDTITAYSLEDNELYLRHLFGLLVQTVVTGYILLMAWTGSNLSFLDILMLIVGCIKYGERTWSLWKASSDELQDSMLSSPDHGPNYAKLMDEYSLRQAEGFSVNIQEVIEDQDELNRVAAGQSQTSEENMIKAYTMFQIFKRLFADLILSYQEQEKSQSSFKDMESKDAFDVIEIELGFMYDLLYTKATVIYSSLGIFCRFLTFSTTCYVLVVFSLDDLRKYKMVDVVITFLLLVGAIWLEIYAAAALLLSDQTQRWLIENKKTKILTVINGLRSVPEKINCLQLQWLQQTRWSKCMGQYSLLSLFLNKRPSVISQFPRLEKNWFRLYERHWLNQPTAKFDDDLKEQIFQHVKRKLESQGTKGDHSSLRDLCSQRGKAIVARYKENQLISVKLEWSLSCEFDQSLLLWHIATELCYHTEENVNDSNLKMSLIFSRYMFYLLAVYPYMLPAGIGLIRFRDTRAEAEKFFQERLSSRNNTGSSDGNKDPRVKACETLLRVKTHVSPIKVKGDRSKSVLFDACGLASELNTITNKKVKWEMIRDIWLEMLTFAAIQCNGREHAQQLRRGGELLTHVWLLMAHFGMIEQFQISKGHSRALLFIK